MIQAREMAVTYRGSFDNPCRSSTSVLSPGTLRAVRIAAETISSSVIDIGLVFQLCQSFKQTCSNCSTSIGSLSSSCVDGWMFTLVSYHTFIVLHHLRQYCTTESLLESVSKIYCFGECKLLLSEVSWAAEIWLSLELSTEIAYPCCWWCSRV